jgi:transcription elongation factor Elf1
MPKLIKPKALPRYLPCPKCDNQEADVIVDDAKRYRLYCVKCGYDNYLSIAMRKDKTGR